MGGGSVSGSMDEAWKSLMLSPYDYGAEALYDAETRGLMQKITFTHGGPDYDKAYPEGIPTSIDITLNGGMKSKVVSSCSLLDMPATLLQILMVFWITRTRCWATLCSLMRTRVS